MGFIAYLFPKLSLADRRALGPLHIFLGKSVFVVGLATMAVSHSSSSSSLALT